MTIDAENNMGMWCPGDHDYENPLEFALFGLARQNKFRTWIPMKAELPILDLGPGSKFVEGALRLDAPEYNFDAYITHDRYDGDMPYHWGVNCLRQFIDNSVGGIVACHIFEHLFDPRPIIQECARVLAPGCPLNVVVPDADSQIYKQDVDHKTAFCLDSWKTLLDNGGYYDNHAPQGLALGCNFKFAIKDGNEIIVTQLIKV